MPRIAAVLIGLSLLAPSSAQEKEKPKGTPGDVMIEKYLAGLTDQISQRTFGGAKSLEEWEAMRPRLRQEYLDMLGLWPLPEKTPLHATVTGTVERDDVVIEKLHFQSMPGLYVTGNLYRPGEVKKKLPAILYVCGHSGRGRDGRRRFHVASMRTGASASPASAACKSRCSGSCAVEGATSTSGVMFNIAIGENSRTGSQDTLSRMNGRSQKVLPLSNRL